MQNETNKKTKFLSILFSVLVFGALWGILEATLGTFLHLPFISKAGMFAASSTVMIPLAFALMAKCYKKTNSFYAVYLMGIVASLIKLSVALIVGFRASVYNPAIYIVVEALIMGTAIAVFKPTNVLSLKTLGAFIIGNTVYQFAYLMINMAMGGTNIFASQKAWELVGVNYLFTMNGLAILYTFVGGLACYGIYHLAEKANFKVKFDINKLIYSPIGASVMMTVALGLTLTFAAII